MITKSVRAIWMLVLFLASGCQWFGRKSDSMNAVSNPESVPAVLVVKAVQASRQEWIISTPITGNLRTLSTVEIKPEVGGRLTAVYFTEGDLVRKGQLLAEIDPVNYQLAYDQAEAALKVAQAGLERAEVSADHAKTEKERADNLLRSGGITQKDHQLAVTGIKEAETQVRLAEAQCGQARAALAIADKALKDCRISAPAEGHVQKRYFDKGSLLSPGVALYTLVDNNQLELECVVPAYKLANLGLGQRAVFQTPTWGERQFDGVLAAINPEIESDSRSVRLKIKIANPKGELRSGMYARGEIVTSVQPQAVVIPRDCLIPEREGSQDAGIYVVREGKAHRLDIRIGDSQEDRVWVPNGLDEGEWVIKEIGPSVKEGVAVRVSK
jgi:RND family efflux transporter MFP subunit